MRPHIFAWSCLVAAFLINAAAAEELLAIEAKVPLGEVAGRIDHMAIDVKRQHLFVAELGNGSVGVVDLHTRTVIHRLADLNEPQGVSYVEAGDQIYVASGGDGSVRRYDAGDFAPLAALKLGRDADNVRVSAARRQLVVGYGDGALAVLDALSGQRLTDIGLAAHPESFQLTADGGRAFVNVPDARQVAVVDIARGQQVASWRGDAAGNFPMALDEPDGHLFVVYRSPPMLIVFDTAHETTAATLPTCGDADDVFFDRQRRRIYVSCGAGVVAVVQESGASYREVARLPTVAGARTSLFVPELDRLYVGVRARGREPASIWVFRPGP